MAADHDAVHLTVTGYLPTPGVAITLPSGAGATALAGWDPDATFWLRDDALTVVDEPVEWHVSPDCGWVRA